jgi:hypothetical protein
LRAVFELGGDLWATSASGEQALGPLIEHGSESAALWLMDQSKKGRKKLAERLAREGGWARRAAKGGCARVLRALLEAGAAAGGQGADGATPLGVAVANDQVGCLELLLEFGADIDEPDARGRTPLMVAVEQCGEEIVKLLLARGADANARDPQGETALGLAIEQGDAAAVEALARSTDLSARNAKGQTPIEQAIAEEFWRAADSICAVAGEAASLTAVLAFASRMMPRAASLVEGASIRGEAEIASRAAKEPAAIDTNAAASQARGGLGRAEEEAANPGKARRQARI